MQTTVERAKHAERNPTCETHKLRLNKYLMRWPSIFALACAIDHVNNRRNVRDIDVETYILNRAMHHGIVFG